MGLSKRKLKYIQRFAGKRTPEELVRELGLPEEVVVEAIEEVTGQKVRKKAPRHPGEAAIWSLAIVAFLAPSAVIQDIFHFAELPKSALIQVGALLALALWLWSCRSGGVLKIIPCGLYYPLGGWLLWSLTSVWWSSSRFSAVEQWIQWFAAIVVFFIGVQCLADRGRPRLLFTAILAGGLLVALLGILQELLEVQWIRQEVPPAATFGNKNLAAQFMVLAFPAGVALFLASERRTGILGLITAVSVFVAFLVFTVARASWIAVAVELLVFGSSLAYVHFHSPQPQLMSRSHRVALGLGVVATLGLVNLSPGGASSPVEGVIRLFSEFRQAAFSGLEPAEATVGLKKRNTATERMKLYRNTLEIVKAHPVLGVGPANFRVHYPMSTVSGISDRGLRLYRQPRRAHNDYLQMTAELGIPGLTFLIWGLGALLVSSYRWLRSDPGGEERIWLVASLAALAGMAANASFSYPFYNAVPPFYVAIFAAVVILRI